MLSLLALHATGRMETDSRMFFMVDMYRYSARVDASRQDRLETDFASLVQ